MHTAVITLIVIFLVALIFFMGLFTGTNMNTCENKINLPDKVTSETNTDIDELKKKISSILNSTENFEQSRCDNLNSNYKELINYYLDFYGDKNGVFSKYFKYSSKFVDDDDTTFTNGMVLGNEELNTSEQIKSNNSVVFKILNTFRNKINSATDINYKKLYNDYFFDSKNVEGGTKTNDEKKNLFSDIGMEPTYNKNDLSENDVNMILLMMVPFLLSLIFVTGDKSELYDFNIFFYDSKNDLLLFNPKFTDLEKSNKDFVQKMITNRIINDEKELTKNNINEKKNDLKQNSQFKDLDIDKNIKNIEFELMFKSFNKPIIDRFMNNKPLIPTLKELVIQMNDSPKQQARKYYSSIYFNFINSLDITKVDKCL